MRRLAVTAIMIASCFPRISAADEAKDAVSLLSYAFKCPIPAATMKGNKKLLEINYFEGNASQFVLHMEFVTEGDSGIHTNTVAFEYADIEKVEVKTRGDSTYIDFECARDRKWVSWNSDVTGKGMPGWTVEVCDLDSARHVKLGLDTLIRINRDLLKRKSR
jgi:hypothetical protein